MQGLPKSDFLSVNEWYFLKKGADRNINDRNVVHERMSIYFLVGACIEVSKSYMKKTMDNEFKIDGDWVFELVKNAQCTLQKRRVNKWVRELDLTLILRKKNQKEERYAYAHQESEGRSGITTTY